MKLLFPLVAAVLLTACSDAPVVKKVEKPPEPLTGREGFYKTFPAAHTWSTDAQPMRVRSIEMNELKADPAKAPAWEVTYTSESKGRSKIFTWSALEAEGLHQGVYGAQEESWRPGGAEKPFPVQALKIDTPDALQTAIAHSVTYFKNIGTSLIRSSCWNTPRATRTPRGGFTGAILSRPRNGACSSTPRPANIRAGKFRCSVRTLENTRAPSTPLVPDRRAGDHSCVPKLVSIQSIENPKHSQPTGITQLMFETPAARPPSRSSLLNSPKMADASVILQSKAGRYAVSLIALLLAALLTVLIVHFKLPRQIIGYAFLLVIIGSAWWGGYGPGLITTFATLLLGPYLVQPSYSIREARVSTMPQVVLISLLISRMAGVGKKLREANEKLDERVRTRTLELESANISLREREAQLIAQAGKLAESNADLEQFAYFASHDLQEPLRMIAIYAELLEERSAPVPTPNPPVMCRWFATPFAAWRGAGQRSAHVLARMHDDPESHAEIDPREACGSPS